jgi:hypothetical protein
MKLIKYCLVALLFSFALSKAQVASNPADFDKYTGVYQVTPAMFLWVRRDGSRFFVRPTSQAEQEAIPKGTNVLAFANAPTEMTFSDNDVLLRNGNLERHATRVSADFAKNMEDALARRIRDNQPSPGTEASLRRYIQSLENGMPNYDEMEPVVATKVRTQLTEILANMKRLGALKAVTFKSVSPEGMDIYDLEFERGRAEARMAPLTPDGKVQIRGFSPLL